MTRRYLLEDSSSLCQRTECESLVADLAWAARWLRLTSLSSCAAERVNAPLSDDPTVQVQGPAWASSHFVCPLFNYISYHWIPLPVQNSLNYKIIVASSCTEREYNLGIKLLESYTNKHNRQYYWTKLLVLFSLLRVNAWSEVVSVGKGAGKVMYYEV